MKRSIRKVLQEKKVKVKRNRKQVASTPSSAAIRSVLVSLSPQSTHVADYSRGKTFS